MLLLNLFLMLLAKCAVTTLPLILMLRRASALGSTMLLLYRLTAMTFIDLQRCCSMLAQ